MTNSVLKDFIHQSIFRLDEYSQKINQCFSQLEEEDQFLRKLKEQVVGILDSDDIVSVFPIAVAATYVRAAAFKTFFAPLTSSSTSIPFPLNCPSAL